jgi:hypothetical protein
MNKKIISIAIFFSIANLLYSQSVCREVREPSFYSMRSQLIERIMNRSRLKSGTECDKKIVRLNIYYMQDDNGRKNFSETGDGTGSSYNGKNFAYDMIDYVNSYYAINNKLRIPPNNSIPNNHKDIRFVIEGIYYIRNSAINKEIDTAPNGSGGWNRTEPSIGALQAVRQGPIDSVVHIFVHGVGTIPSFNAGVWSFEKNYGGGGWGGGGMVKVGTYARYWALKNKNSIPSWPKDDNMDWIWNAEGGLWEHELGHVLALSHTVINLGFSSNAGVDLCPTMRDDTFFSAACDDDLPNTETPSAWYMRDTLNAPIHPGERRDSLKKIHTQWWSNNTMDYNNEHALSPMQINLMHEFLDTTRRWLVETMQKNDRNYCTWIGNRIAHYGRRVELNRLCTLDLRVRQNTNRKIIASQTTEIFGGFEVLSGGEFEIINTCPKP